MVIFDLKTAQINLKLHSQTPLTKPTKTRKGFGLVPSSEEALQPVRYGPTGAYYYKNSAFGNNLNSTFEKFIPD